jgi:hypothetical protein
MPRTRAASALLPLARSSSRRIIRRCKLATASAPFDGRVLIAVAHSFSLSVFRFYLGAWRHRIAEPMIPAHTEAIRMPSLAAVSCSLPVNAKSAMKSDIVNPIPASHPAP